MFFYLNNIVLPDGLVSIGDEVFYCCKNLRSITIPDSVTTIGGGVFYGCASLVNVILNDNIKHLDTPTDNYWPGFFEGCASLKSITIPNSVTYIDDNTVNSIGKKILFCTSKENIKHHENQWCGKLRLLMSFIKISLFSVR